MPILAVLAALCALAPPAASPEPPVGFIWHFPFVDVGTNQVPRAGVNAMIARVPWREAEPEPGRFAFTAMDRQIAEAERGHYKLVLLLECNAFCAPAWLVEQVEKAGEAVQDVDGRTTGQGPHGGVPRADSPVFLAAQDRFLRATIAHVRTADRGRVITHYQAGVEWWFPYSFRYTTADIDRFRAWLGRRYGTVARLNASWGASFPDFARPAPPRITVDALFERNRSGCAPVRLSPGAPAPGTNVRAAVDDWSRFWYETAAETIDDLARRVKLLDPTRRTVTFLTNSYALPAEWDYVQWSSVALDEVARRARHVDDLGMQLCVSAGDPYRVTAGLDVARKYGKPLWVLDLLDFTMGVRVSRASMRAATAAAVQHGAAGLFYCCWNGARDFDFHPEWSTDELRRMLTEGREAIRQVRGLRPAPEVAIVLPLLPASPADPAGRKNDPGSFMGWYRLLEELHQPADVVTLRDLEEGTARLAGYRWILVPDCAYIPPGALAQLARYVRQGGRVVAAGRFAQFDEAGRPLVQATGLGAAERWPDDGRAYAGPLRRVAYAGDTPPLIQFAEPSPARERLRRRVGARLRGFLRRQAISAVVDVLSEHPDVSVMPFRRGRDLTLFAVNRAARPAEGVRVRIRTAGSGASALADLRPAGCQVRRAGGRLDVVLPPFSTSCLLRLISPPAKGGT